MQLKKLFLLGPRKEMGSEHVARVAKKRSKHGILGRKTEKNSSERPRQRWENNIAMI
jgi:hypothetical protein